MSSAHLLQSLHDSPISTNQWLWGQKSKIKSKTYNYNYKNKPNITFSNTRTPNIERRLDPLLEVQQHPPQKLKRIFLQEVKVTERERVKRVVEPGTEQDLNSKVIEP